jgi:hypothetical protein
MMSNDKLKSMARIEYKRKDKKIDKGLEVNTLLLLKQLEQINMYQGLKFKAVFHERYVSIEPDE